MSQVCYRQGVCTANSHAPQRGAPPGRVRLALDALKHETPTTHRDHRYRPRPITRSADASRLNRTIEHPSGSESFVGAEHADGADGASRRRTAGIAGATGERFTCSDLSLSGTAKAHHHSLMDGRTRTTSSSTTRKSNHETHARQRDSAGRDPSRLGRRSEALRPRHRKPYL